MKDMKLYESPQVTVNDMELSSFLCASIGTMTNYFEVDEIVNTGTEDLDFDSDYLELN